jgi:hypothetical protein
MLDAAIVCRVVSGCRGAPGFKLTKRYPFARQWGAFVFDASSSRLYVSHGTEVEVVNADSGKLVGQVEDTLGVQRDSNRSQLAPWFRDQWKRIDRIGLRQPKH